MAGENVTVHKVGLSVHALNTLEQVGNELTSYGLILGIAMIYEQIQKIAIRANELHDKELDSIAERCEKENDFDANYFPVEDIREIAGRLEQAVLIGFFIYYTVKIVLWLGHKMEILITKIRKEKCAFDDSEICDKYEYDESGLGKMYGACCGTCVNSNRKECPKTKGENK